MQHSACVDLQVAPAELADLPSIADLISEFGETNVDVRPSVAAEAAVDSGGLHTFKHEGALVATGGIYPYSTGAFSELGTSCWHSAYRRRGGAEASAIMRAVLASLWEPGTAVVSEIYDTSQKSARILSRCGALRAERVPRSMHQHAYEANPFDPVAHYVIPPWSLPACAKRLISLVEGEHACGPDGELRLRFAAQYGFHDLAMRCALERLAMNSLGVVGHNQDIPIDLSKWLSAISGQACLSSEEFLSSVPPYGANGTARRGGKAPAI